MKSIARIVSLSTLLIVSPCVTFASQTLYDIDFSAPFHRVGNAASLDDGPTPRRGPSGNVFQLPTVVSSFGSLTDGALRFASPSNTSFLSQTSLGIEQGFFGVGVDLPEYRLEFDLVIDRLAEISDEFSVLLDSPQSNKFSFRGDGKILNGGSIPIGAFQENTLLRVAVAFLTDDELIQISVNGSQLYSGRTFLDATEGLRTIRLSLSDRNSRSALVYVDNIVVLGIPEPSAFALLAMPLLQGRRRRRGDH